MWWRPVVGADTHGLSEVRFERLCRAVLGVESDEGIARRLRVPVATVRAVRAERGGRRVTVPHPYARGRRGRRRSE